MKTIMWLGFVLAALSAGGEEFIVKRGQTITIKCGGSSKDSPKTLEWKRGDDLIHGLFSYGLPRKGGGDTAKRSRLTQNNLLIQNVQDTDAGAYTCYLDHKPHKHKLYVLSVSVSLSPNNELQQGSEATLQCDVSGLDVPPTVEWESPQKTLEGSETVQLKPVETSHAGLWTCKISHGGTTYTETLNVKVKGPPTRPPSSSPPDTKSACKNCHPNATEKFNEKPQLLLGLSMWMWIAIGLGSLALVVLVVFVIVLDRKIKKRRRRARKLKNMRQPLNPKLYCQCSRPTAAAPPPQGQRRVKPSAPPLQQR
ncbi:roundabout homolog 2-like isoform X2 [Myripristis murdjan]|uniref:roundabout homolog 2-like isoform X2 n=1 Tax=Myripristis murdjan TaxID=586833 RepID=UPI001175DC89|nr:roundabout homolog 2-like isoform X2 [Myripristis murdjan]